MKQFRKNANEMARQLHKTPSANAYIIHSMAADGKDAKHLPDTDELCGIEHLLCYQVCKALLTSKDLTLQQVLGEQARQQSVGEHDVNKIAEVSSKASLFSRLWRYRIAVMNCSE
jgi:hypothetical protein